MWIDIGQERTELLKSIGFDIDSMRFGFADRVNRGKQTHPRTLAFEYVRDTPLAELRAELTV